MDFLEKFKKIKDIKKELKNNMISNFSLLEIPGPSIMRLNDGISANLGDYDRDITFDSKDSGNVYKILQSSNKWKRNALNKYNFQIGQGLICSTIAIRRDAPLTKTSSLVWDELAFEWIIEEQLRNENELISKTKLIYKVIRDIIVKHNKKINLPEDLMFYSSFDLDEMYPKLAPKRREDKVAVGEKAFILTKIGHKLNNGEPHSHRGFDNNDWSLNAEIVVWNENTKSSFSIATVGIRVDKEILEEQAFLSKEEKKMDQDYHKKILSGEMPLSMGGAIFQSRILMLALDSKHIGEVQVSIWENEKNEELL